MNYWLTQEVQAHYAQDIPLMAQMNVKTVRVYGDFGDTASDYQAVLDTFYANGIMVIMDVVNSKADIEQRPLFASHQHHQKPSGHFDVGNR